MYDVLALWKAFYIRLARTIQGLTGKAVLSADDEVSILRACIKDLIVVATKLPAIDDDAWGVLSRKVARILYDFDITLIYSNMSITVKKFHSPTNSVRGMATLQNNIYIVTLLEERPVR